VILVCVGQHKLMDGNTEAMLDTSKEVGIEISTEKTLIFTE
jgi:hypothetical protein